MASERLGRVRTLMELRSAPLEHRAADFARDGESMEMAFSRLVARGGNAEFAEMLAAWERVETEGMK